MTSGRINGPVDGNLDRSYATCAKCQCRRMKKNLHALLSRDDKAVIAWLCERCAPHGGIA